MKAKTILITGGSSGIGKKTGQYLASLGHTVIGTTRRFTLESEQKFSKGTMSMVTMDVTKPLSVKEAVKIIYFNCKSIDVLINNAGYGIAGALEDTSVKEANNMFLVNLFGLMEVSNQVLPYFREQGYGQIINIGSVAGYVSLPFQGLYSASKAALLAYSKTLRNELRPHNINVSVIEPGDIRTNFTANRQYTNNTTSKSPYYIRVKRSIGVMEKDEINGSNPIVIAKEINKQINKKHPAIAITVGLKYKIFKLLFYLVPLRLSEYIVYRIYGK